MRKEESWFPRRNQQERIDFTELKRVCVWVFTAASQGSIVLDQVSLGYRDRLTAIVKDVIGDHPLARPDRISESLAEAGLTSLDLVKLVLGIEREFGVSIGGDDMEPENFQTLDSLEALVQRLCC